MATVGPRNRAPLGMKTTNAKAKGFQTPAPAGDRLKPEKTNRKSSTAQKVKKAAPVVQLAQPEALSKLDEDDVPDVEYAPPKPAGKKGAHHKSFCGYDLTIKQNSQMIRTRLLTTPPFPSFRDATWL